MAGLTQATYEYKESADTMAGEINAAVEKEVQAARERAYEKAADGIRKKADERKCLAYGHDDRYCSYCDAYEDAIDISEQVIRSLKSSEKEGE